MRDPYKATWVSHSSMRDFLNCPRLYYLRNVYKDPISKNKITIVTPALALGQAVHEVLEALSVIPTEQRLKVPLMDRFEEEWGKVSGKKGGFSNSNTEKSYKERGKEMINRVIKNPGPLERKAVKIKHDFVPNYWISEEDEIILSGKIDWLEYIPRTNSVHIIDFKTSKILKEDPDSLQLPIYNLLVNNLQSRNIAGASYWYLNFADEPEGQILPSLEDSYDKVMKVAKRIKLARALEHYKCPKDGCNHCLPFEEIIKGRGVKVGETSYQDVYIVDNQSAKSNLGEEILL